MLNGDYHLDLIKMTDEVKKAYATIRKHEAEKRGELVHQVVEFEKLMDNMIANTPTGDFRNGLCNLNILFHAIKFNLYEKDN